MAEKKVPPPPPPNKPIEKRDGGNSKKIESNRPEERYQTPKIPWPDDSKKK